MGVRTGQATGCITCSAAGEHRKFGRGGEHGGEVHKVPAAEALIGLGSDEQLAAGRRMASGSAAIPQTPASRASSSSGFSRAMGGLLLKLTDPGSLARICWSRSATRAWAP
jgi:hypothetical protein